MTTFPSVDFTGTPITQGPVTVVDQVNLNPGGRANQFSVRVEGFIFADTTGTYQFETQSDDGVRLFVDGTRIINNYDDHAEQRDVGTIDLVAGRWYPILLEHYENGGRQRLRLRWQSPTDAGFVFPPTAALSRIVPTSAEGPPLFTQDDRVAFTIAEDARRDLQAAIASNQRANTEARDRHAAALRCRALREEDDVAFEAECQDTLHKRGTPLRFNGTLSADAASTKLLGDFYGETAGRGSLRHIYFGDFNVSRFEGGDVSAVLSARYARERMVGDRLVGTFLSLALTQSSLDNVVEGTRTGYGLSAGVYMVDQLSSALTWDGFLSVGTGRNNLDIEDGGDEIEGDYSTLSALLGFALSGKRSFETFELRPEVNLSLGYTDIGDVEVTGGASPIVEAGSVTLGRISFEPDFVIPLANGRSRFDTKEVWITPSLTCEYQDTTFSDTECGGGLALEWTANRDDGLLDVSFRLSREVLGGDYRDSFGFQLESGF